MVSHAHCYLCGSFGDPRIFEPVFCVSGIPALVAVAGWVVIGYVGVRFTGEKAGEFLSQCLQVCFLAEAASFFLFDFHMYFNMICIKYINIF